ncbi:ABC transporter permease [Vitiosangium sp. GDMCC 1.1324]|uniref:MlaE family ABC transporter permease n=1 Tax=Vitiosangium sp. (strain GDMCC 1.1324) TaxID=2138576 RepID=UPI000D39550E|nr:ABC transporter permease [Vitiosangium sp. GDMCC 1.1324]PTL85697.1 ABC transporter permease [Vitiosangium sp. GDMCC 1.1324]
MTEALVWLGQETLGAVRAVGALTLVLARTVLGLVRMDRRELLRGLVQFGWGSLPLAVATGALTGATVVVQTALYVERFGARAVLGWAAGYAVLWEFGPLLLGLVMAARLGARNAAELATMQVGGQLEGLRGIGLDPFAVLVAPRVVAMTASMSGLSALTFLVAVLFESAAALFTLGLPVRSFFDSFEHMLHATDALGGMVKASTFGLAIALVSTAVGLRARGGARAVGQAAAGAVVLGCAAIFLLDFLLTTTLARWVT